MHCTDLSFCTALTYLDCSDNQLTALNVSNCPLLEQLYGHNNRLATLDLSACASLKYIIFSYNELTKLDVSTCASLVSLDCSNNRLTTLNIDGCTGLTHLICTGNQLTSLDCTYIPALIVSEIGGYNILERDENVTVIRLPKAILRLPSNITHVDDEAFASTRAEYIAIGKNCTTIGAHAFANSENLQWIDMMYSNADIESSAFDSCPKACIVTKNRNIADMAKRNGIRCVYVDF